jgi:CDP-diacylglycerol--glycerol-3-phosphate 3-phosphatidyltransferase
MMNIQKFSDNFIEKTFLRFIPYSIKPNVFSYIRIALVPVIYFLLFKDHLVVATILFVIAASTDFIDGALARTRDQITDLGKVLDPIADKMLIATVLIHIGFEYLIIKLFVAVIAFEIAAVFASSLLATYLGRPVGANLFGKIKMILQCFAVGFFLLGIMLNQKILISVSEYILFIALFFALLAGVENLRRRYMRHREKILAK